MSRELGASGLEPGQQGVVGGGRTRGKRPWSSQVKSAPRCFSYSALFGLLWDHGGSPTRVHNFLIFRLQRRAHAIETSRAPRAHKVHVERT